MRSVVGDPRVFGRVYLSQGNVAGGSRYGDMIALEVMYNVKYVVAGTELGVAQEVRSGMAAENLSRIAGMAVSGWYVDEALTTPYGFGPVSGDITLYAGLALDVSVTTPTLVATLSANLRVNVAGGSAGNLKAYLQVGEDLLWEASLANGTALMRIAASPAAGLYKLVVIGDGAYGSCDINVVPYNTNIWEASAYTDNGRLLVLFNDGISLKDASKCATIGSAQYNAAVLEDNRHIEVLGVDADALPSGTAVSIKGVKYPVLFPSYSFTFTVNTP